MPSAPWRSGRGTSLKPQELPGLVMTNSLLLKMIIEIVDRPIKNGGSFHSNVKLPEATRGIQKPRHSSGLAEGRVPACTSSC